MVRGARIPLLRGGKKAGRALHIHALFEQPVGEEEFYVPKLPIKQVYRRLRIRTADGSVLGEELLEVAYAILSFLYLPENSRRREVPLLPLHTICIELLP